ncbi:MAG: hypothetical protein ACR2RB_22150 [Gammaproteobacteria bacterium]
MRAKAKVSMSVNPKDVPALAMSTVDPPALAPLSVSDTYESRGLRLVVKYLQDRNEQKPERKQHVLDLGPAVIPNVEFLSRYNCRVQFEDITDVISKLNSALKSELTTVERVADDLFAHDPRVRFDVVLAWDLFNYLELGAIKALIERLGRFCKKGTVLFVFVRIAEEMPRRPTTFKFVDHHHLFYTVGSRNARPCPRYSVVDLMNQLSGFTVVRTYFMPNGMHEYLLRFRYRPG